MDDDQDRKTARLIKSWARHTSDPALTPLLLTAAATIDRLLNEVGRLRGENLTFRGIAGIVVTQKQRTAVAGEE